MVLDLEKRIKAIREQAGDNPNSAARRLGISRAGYIKWEDGDTKNMKLGNLLQFCDVYHVDPVELITGELRPGKTLIAMQPTAGYSTDPEVSAIADAYARLPTAKRLEIRLAIARQLLETKVENPAFDTGDLGQLVSFTR